MALAAHQIQGSYSTFPLRPQSWNRGMELKQFVTTLHMVVRTDWFLLVKCKSCLSVGVPLVQQPREKSSRISSFKGSAQNDGFGGRLSGSKSKNSSKLSYIPHKGEKTLIQSPKVQDGPLSYASNSDERMAGSVAIQKLFKNWLMLLRTQSRNEVVDEILEGLAPREVSEMQNGAQKKERGEVLRAIWYYFLCLDAAIKIPLLMFIPWYLAVNVVYGAEVSKELNPLWVLGPLIVALYIKILRGLCTLYVFSFKQSVKVVQNLPTYYLLAYNYIACGKLKDDVRAYFWQPLTDIKNLDYKELSKRKVNDLKVWTVEMFLDFVESIWPYYCRTIRFLKRANLI